MQENREESAKFEYYYLLGSIHMSLVNKRPFFLLLIVELSLITSECCYFGECRIKSQRVGLMIFRQFVTMESRPRIRGN